MTEPRLNNDRLLDLPEPVQVSFGQFQSTGDPMAFRVVLHHLLTDFKPEWAEQLPDSLADGLHLINDLDFDSLAITEMVFYFEDLLGVSITNSELQGLITIGDLRKFLFRHMQKS